MNKAVIFAAMLLILTIGVVVFTIKDDNFLPYIPQDSFLPEISVAGTPIKVLVADTSDEHMRGLSGHDPLPLNQGMLFVFADEGVRKIWMKDMKFPLDIMWADSEGKIMHLEENIHPETYPKVFGPDYFVKYVLEVPAGFSEIYNIKVGDTIGF
jgi:uncharacterized protein